MNIEKYIIDYSKLKVGDKLWSIQLGDCKVVSIKPVETSTFPVICGMRDKTISYTDDGKLGRAEAFPSLFTSNPFADTSGRTATFAYIEESGPINQDAFDRIHQLMDEAKRPAKPESILQEAGKSLRYNQGKTDWSFISFEALKPLVEVLEFGARKYARDNWKLPTDPEIPLQSMLRHVIELAEGHTIDSESGAPTIGHIMANAMFYAYHTIVTEKGGAK